MEDHELGLCLLTLQVLVTNLPQLLECLVDVSHSNPGREGGREGGKEGEREGGGEGGREGRREGGREGVKNEMGESNN